MWFGVVRLVHLAGFAAGHEVSYVHCNARPPVVFGNCLRRAIRTKVTSRLWRVEGVNDLLAEISHGRDIDVLSVPIKAVNAVEFVFLNVTLQVVRGERGVLEVTRTNLTVPR